MATDNIGIDKSLEIVVRMLVDVFGFEDGLYVIEWLQSTAACFVIYYSDDAVVKQVETVYSPSDADGRWVFSLLC